MSKIISSKRIKNSLLRSILTIMLYFLWNYIVSYSLSLFKIDDFIIEVILNTTSNIVLSIILIDIYKKELISALKKISKEKLKIFVVIVKWAGVLALASAITNLIVTIITKDFQMPDNNRILIDYFETSPIMVFIVTTFCYPIIEEIVFKKTIRDITDSKWTFIIISSFFYWYFNVAYTGVTLTALFASTFYFIQPLITGYIYDKYDNVMMPILVRAIYNAFVALLMWLV